jgi:nucleoside-diphosphate-sugar epimerase
MNDMIIAVAGGGGDLGGRIVKALIQRGAKVRALVRHDASEAEVEMIKALGADVVAANASDVVGMANALAGMSCVVSALNGLREVIIDRQSILLNAAVKAKVPRFISSDYSEDFTTTVAGDNRNLDLRREFMAIADRAPIAMTSILNGAFMDMLGAEMPIIQKGMKRVLYWQSATQLLDFTTKDNVAAYTAAAALDDKTPRILRIAGESVNVQQIAQAMKDVSGVNYRPQWVGGLGVLSLMIRIAKLVAPQPKEPFPPWQGMQYMRDMFSGRGKLQGLNTDRYPGIAWTTVKQHLTNLT